MRGVEQKSVKVPGITVWLPVELRARVERFAEARRWSLNVAIQELAERGLDVEEGRG